MRKISFILVAFCLPFLFVGCEKVLPIDTEASEAQLVLNAIPSSGRQLTAYFAYSRYFLDNNNNHPVNGVDMVINVNGNAYRPDSVVRCNYYFPYQLCDDDTVAIRVMVGDHEVTARTYVPRTPQVSNLQALVDTSGTIGRVFGLGAFRLLSVKFDLADYADHQDYYYITLQQRDSGSRYSTYFDRYDTIDTTFNAYFICLDRKLTSPDVSAISGMGDAFFTRLLFSDKKIEGKNYNVALMLLLLRDTTEIAPFIHKYTLNVESVTPERMKYITEVATATNRLQYFSEHADVYSNVSGALGIFSGNNHLTFPLDPDTMVLVPSSLPDLSGLPYPPNASGLAGKSQRQR